MATSPGNDVAGPVIRPALEADAETIGQLWEKLVAYHHALDEHLPIATEDGGDIYARRARESVGDTHTRFLVAVDNDRVIGFVLGVVVDMLPEIFQQQYGGFLADIFVEEAYRNQGIGRQLAEALMTWFRSRGVQKMEWYVAAQNAAGRAFWAQIGGADVMVRMRMML